MKVWTANEVLSMVALRSNGALENDPFIRMLRRVNEEAAIGSVIEVTLEGLLAELEARGDVISELPPQLDLKGPCDCGDPKCALEAWRRLYQRWKENEQPESEVESAVSAKLTASHPDGLLRLEDLL